MFWLEPWPCGTNTNLALGPAYQGIVDYEGVDWYEYESSNTLITNYYPSGATYTLNCYTTGDVLPASTRFAVVGNFPSSITLGGSVPFTTQYGMPIMYVYGGTGSLVATEYATSVSSGGAEATFPFPSGLSEDGYAIAVMNQTSASPGSIPAGVNLLSIAKSTTIAGNPFGVSVGALTNNTDTCISYTLEGRTVTTCTSGSGYETLPIVSLYSTNQVLIGSTAVDVGSNPTAVAAYSAPSVPRKVSGDDVTTTILSSGETRAVVANSGSNSVSVLDIVNDALFYNVTVGNQPVALAVSSDGSTAYVANYKDSTVTKVNLAAGTATTTVAVGGKPTSVALSSSGILWVGGVGSLTEINASTMTVEGTEAISNKTVVALGYSDTRSEVVATTVDGSGNVYADEISPSTFKAGGTYAPVASNEVSAVGTHLDSDTEAEVRSYTATLASTQLINTNQVGAPPLVVQDNWAVVSATPTGFTITDIAGHQVLVSQTTSSPVTAIAVDPNLNVVYLTMPDSNTLLTVPLPGIN